jgi:hypothetical protein
MSDDLGIMSLVCGVCDIKVDVWGCTFPCTNRQGRPLKYYITGWPLEGRQTRDGRLGVLLPTHMNVWESLRPGTWREFVL